MLCEPREGLLHDWEQGNYIEGGVYDGRLDSELCEQLEAEARKCIKHWYYEDEQDMRIWWSGGIDAAVVFHMVWDMDLQDEIPAVTFRTPEHYDSSVDYVQRMADRLDYDLDEVVDDFQDIEWVAENPKRCLFPNYTYKEKLYIREYRRPAGEHQQEHGYDLALTGLRMEHGSGKDTRGFVWDNNGGLGEVNGNPIIRWKTGHVLWYLDKYSIPIPPAYRTLTNGANHPWHRELTEKYDTDKTRSIPHCFWIVRQATVKDGYTDFWTDHILEHFPEAEKLATGYAAENDMSVIPIADGYNHGADAQQVPYPCGPTFD